MGVEDSREVITDSWAHSHAMRYSYDRARHLVPEMVDHT